MVEFLELPTKPNFSDEVDQSVCYAKVLLKYIDNVIVTMGKHGVVVGRKSGSATDPFLNIHKTPASQTPQPIRHYEFTDVPHIESVSGAGDCFASGFISALLAGEPEQICVSVGFAAAKLTLQTTSTVPDKLFGREHEAWRKPAVYETYH
nr:unnamed protein product [Callosobruchus chinensis]